jgi:hypothetical protein
VIGGVTRASRVLDQDPPALRQHGVVGGVPGHAQPLGDAGHGQVLTDDPDQGPGQSSAGDPRPRLGGGGGGVLAPHVSALRAPVPADRDLKGGGAPPEGARARADV